MLHVVGVLGHAVFPHGHIAGDHLANSLFQPFLIGTQSVGDIVPHRVHRMVGFVAVKGPVSRCIGDKFDVALDDAVTTVTVRRFSEASDGNIHTDHWSKLITVLVYFNTHWDERSGQLRLLRSATDIEDYAAEVPPAGGTLLAFRRTRASWHGHKRFVGERRMMQLNFISNSRLARYTQTAARFSTRMVKQIARMGQGAGPDRPSNT